MEQVSLITRARQAQRIALDEQSQHNQRCIQTELAEAGPNPVVMEPDVLTSCIVYLEARVMESASHGRGEVVVLYTDVPAIQERMIKTRNLRHIQDLDKQAMIKAVIPEWGKQHGGEIQFNPVYMGNSFRISWY